MSSRYRGYGTLVRVETKDTITVITGAGSGIGAATARMLASAGGKVVLGDVSEEGLDRTAKAVAEAGGTSAQRVTDVTKESDVAALMDLALERFGGLNVVVPCAGIFRDAFTVRVKDGKVSRVMSLEDFEAVIDVNLTGTFLTLREGLRRMVDHDQRGVLFCISSINKEGEIGQLNYSATKVAVGLWPKMLVGELAAQSVTGIRVVGVAPGYVETPILENMSEEALGKVLANVPLGRLIRTDEITALLGHVIENEAIDATTIEVAGGVLARGIAK
jgi:3-oxoacyl-[acyl-carrier protein] reductase